MTVTKKEIEELQKQVEKRIEAIRLSMNPDSSLLFDLNMLNSNISLFLLASEFKEEPFELKASDKLIIDALKNFRSSSSKKLDITVFAQETSTAVLEILDLLSQLEKNTKEIPEKIFAENVLSHINLAKICLNQISLLKKQSKKTLTMWQTQVIPLPIYDPEIKNNKEKVNLNQTKTSNKTQVKKEHTKENGVKDSLNSKKTKQVVSEKPKRDLKAEKRKVINQSKNVKEKIKTSTKKQSIASKKKTKQVEREPKNNVSLKTSKKINATKTKPIADTRKKGVKTKTKTSLSKTSKSKAKKRPSS